MIQRIQLRRGVASEWQTADPLLASGEMGIELDTYKIKVGDGSKSWNELPYVSGGSGGGGSTNILEFTTTDTNETFKIIGLHNGTLTGVPVNAVAPVAPRTLTRETKLTSVKLDWLPPTAGVVDAYLIYRNGVVVGATDDLSYLDGTVATNTSYSYVVRARDQYGQVGPPSNTVTAFTDLALNVAPSDIEIRWWPDEIPTNGVALIRVNGTDLDTQQLALTLGVDAGLLTATDDPATWQLAI